MGQAETEEEEGSPLYFNKAAYELRYTKLLRIYYNLKYHTLKNSEKK